MENTATTQQRPGRGDGLASTSFILGLVGLVVLPICLGPVAIVLAAVALRRGTAFRRRAQVGLALGIADVVVFAISLAVERSWLVFPGL